MAVVIGYFFRLYSFLLCSFILTALAIKLTYWQLLYPTALGIADQNFLAALLWGLKFDLAIAALFSFVALSFVALMPNLVKTRLSLLVFLWLSGGLLLIGDLIYFTDAGRHLSYEIKDFLNDGTSLISQAFNKYWYSIGVLTVLLMVLSVPFYRCAAHLSAYQLAPQVISRALSLFGLLLVSVLALRGGISGLPMSPLNVYAIGDALQANIASNGAYNISYALLKKEKGKVDRLPINAETSKASILVPLLSQSAPRGSAREKNVVIVLLESWPSVRMQDQKVTPQFNALRDQGVRAEQAYAGGLRTTEGMFSIFCSWQNPLGATVAQSRLQNNRFNCLPRLLKQRGYQTLFLQGSSNDTSGVGSFAQKLGFARSIGKESIEHYSVPKNSWGAQDVDIYAKALSEIEKMQKPFLLAINTNTTHDSRLPRAAAKPFSDNRLNVLHYADSALGEFVSDFKEHHRALFNNTLFVFVADHTANLPVATNLAQRFAIPLLFYAADLPPKRLPGVASQRDIAPSVLDYLSFQPVENFSGHSLLGANRPGFSTLYSAGTLAWVTGDSMLKLNIATGEQRCYQVQSLVLNAIDCSAQRQLAQQLVTFTRMSQDLLFDDKLMPPVGQSTPYRQLFQTRSSTNE